MQCFRYGRQTKFLYGEAYAAEYALGTVDQRAVHVPDEDGSEKVSVFHLVSDRVRLPRFHVRTRRNYVSWSAQLTLRKIRGVTCHLIRPRNFLQATDLAVGAQAVNSCFHQRKNKHKYNFYI